MLKTSRLTKRVEIRLDFGVAKWLEATLGRTFTGSPSYMAPELHSIEPYSFPADIWFELSFYMYLNSIIN